MIDLLFFAQLQEKVGSPKITIEANDISIKEIKEKFLAKYKMDHLLNEAMIAVNEEYSKEDAVVFSGDVVAFIPPVSGG
ncbi:molybdopterin converting factor subunit 1 [Pseudogracilibacillus auburnensis]|uniref:Molybdopterin synthase sulfur carrier subunit n=1 Tax=Pseudogracilibacillus auburnensis TaxID=1494959 RepID=A0A2V3W809_9BACI|nr:molybdopterin converting factor subunit 1 [Pseudogracilibacillus auburnensis]MBO1003616.1 molybdopterin converting factor subunit 1 [Pseudogracilibacillus auburnensis]PXW89304.1 molybdopterin synthase subunit MoaD [Pseudogracilibacillus auburnensis]